MSFNYGSGKGSRFPERPDFGLEHEPVKLPPKPDRWDERYRAYVRAQIIELTSRYKPGLLWFDSSVGGPVISIAEIQAHNPGVVVNSRMHVYGDFQTPEIGMPAGPIEGWWELCDIWPKSGWGYVSPGSENYRTIDWMLGRLKQVRRWNGNYLINVSPRPDGTLPEAYYERMEEFAAMGGFDTLDRQWRTSAE